MRLITPTSVVYCSFWRELTITTKPFVYVVAVVLSERQGQSLVLQLPVLPLRGDYFQQ